MKLNMPGLQDAVDEMALLRANGITVRGAAEIRHHAHDIASGLFYVGLGLFALGYAIVYAADMYAAEGSKVAAYKGGRRDH